MLLLGPLYHLLTVGERRSAVAEAARLLRPGGFVFAAGVNTLTYLRDVIRGDPDDFGRRPAYFLDRLWRDGNLEAPDGQPATMHTTTVTAFRDEISPPFTELVLAGVESFASKHEPEYHRASHATQEVLLHIIERTGTTPEGLGATSHYLFIGRHYGGGEMNAPLQIRRYRESMTPVRSRPIPNDRRRRGHHAIARYVRRNDQPATAAASGFRSRRNVSVSPKVSRMRCARSTVMPWYSLRSSRDTCASLTPSRSANSRWLKLLAMRAAMSN